MGRKKRWIAPWQGSCEKPAIYHCVSRVVDRRFVFGADVAAQLDAARHEGGAEGGNPERVAEIKGRFGYRMHDLGEFMKVLMQRFIQWFNGRHKRTGTLWEQRFKSVIVEGGTAARTMAAYIDLNPVRAGMVEDLGGIPMERLR